MRRARTLATAALGSAVLLPFVGAGTATAADGDTMANLRPVALNGVDASGTAMVTVRGTRIDVTMAASGLLADSPHAAHIHFGADARHECPTAADDANGRRPRSTPPRAARPTVDIVVSLTKTGDTSPEAAWPSTASTPPPAARSPTSAAASRCPPTSPRPSPTASPSSSSTVWTTTTTASTTASTKSDLDPSLPTEATDPAICGVLARRRPAARPPVPAAPRPRTQRRLLALGGGLLLAAAGTGALTARAPATGA